MSTLDDARGLIAQHIVPGPPRSITLDEIRAICNALADAIGERVLGTDLEQLVDGLVDAGNVGGAGALMKATDSSDDVIPGETHLFLTAAERAAIAHRPLNARDYGALGNGVADDSAAIQAAINAAAAQSDHLSTPDTRGGLVVLPPGDYVCAGLVLPAGVRLVGAGYDATSLRKADPGAATFLIETAGYADLTGTDAWFVGDGVPTGFAISHLTIDGGAYPPTSYATDRGGIRIYGKGFAIDVRLRNINGVGLWTECGSQVGQTRAEDMPETRINLYSYRTGGHAIVNRGPHDSKWEYVFVSGSGFAATPGDGNGSPYRAEYLSGSYAGHGEIAEMHVYDSADPVYWDRRHKVGILTTESMQTCGIEIAGGEHSSIAQLEVYKNCRTSGSEQILISASKVTIGHVSGTSSGGDASADLMRVTGDHVNVGGIEYTGDAGKSHAGIVNAGSFNRFEGFLRSVGTAVEQAAEVADNTYEIKAREFTTLVNAAGSYQRTKFKIDALSAGAATIWSGTAPTALTSARYRACTFDVAVRQNGVDYNLRAGFGRQSLWIPATAMVPRSSNGAAAGSFETTTNKVMVDTLDFDPSTIEYAQYRWRPPKKWDKGTIRVRFHWSHASAVSNFGCAWACDGVAISDGEALDAAFGTAVASIDTGGSEDTLYISPETNAITIAGTPGDDDEVILRIWRNATGGSDTLAVDARLHGVTVYYAVAADNDL